MNPILCEDISGIISAELDWGKIDNTTVLISGANGFMTSYLVFSLLERNRIFGTHTHIIALCRNAERAKRRFRFYENDSHLELLIQNVISPVRTDKKIDYFIHAASPAGIFSRQAYPAQTFETNVIGCRNLLELCRCNPGSRFLLLSSVDIYGKMYSERRLEENDSGYLDTMYPRNAYSNGKRAAEALCAVYHAEYGVDTVVARPFQVYGPGMSLEDGRLHGDFIGQIKKRGSIVLKSDGRAKRSFLYLTDATRALFVLLLFGSSGEAYNICDEKGEASVLELASLYQKSAGQGIAIEFDYDRRETAEVKEALPCVLGSSKKLKALGWEPEISLEEGVRRTLRYYQTI